MVDDHFHLKVGDFGLASDEDYVDELAGTKIYMAPEQLADEIHNPKKADIYSLGVVLFVMHSSCFPYRVANEFDDLALLLQN